MKTTYVVQCFSKQKNSKKNELVPDTPLQFKTEHEAVGRAERMTDKRIGVVAFSQDFDEATDEFGDMKVLFKFGELPAGLSDEE